MGIARSTYYDRPEEATDDAAIVKPCFCDEFYGCRRAGAVLRHKGLVKNLKKAANI